MSFITFEGLYTNQFSNLPEKLDFEGYTRKNTSKTVT